MRKRKQTGKAKKRIDEILIAELEVERDEELNSQRATRNFSRLR